MKPQTKMMKTIEKIVEAVNGLYIRSIILFVRF